MEEPGNILLREVSQTKTNMTYHFFTESRKVIQANPYMKQIYKHRKQLVCTKREREVGKGYIRNRELTDTNFVQKIDKQKGFTILLRELYLISYNYLWKVFWNISEYVCMYVYVSLYIYICIYIEVSGVKWQLTPVFLPEKSHGQRSLMGYSPWGCKESDTSEHIHKHIYVCVYVCVYIHIYKIPLLYVPETYRVI